MALATSFRFLPVHCGYRSAACPHKPFSYTPQLRLSCASKGESNTLDGAWFFGRSRYR